jgi:hypothetical protein
VCHLTADHASRLYQERLGVAELLQDMHGVAQRRQRVAQLVR